MQGWWVGLPSPAHLPRRYQRSSWGNGGDLTWAQSCWGLAERQCVYLGGCSHPGIKGSCPGGIWWPGLNRGQLRALFYFYNSCTFVCQVYNVFIGFSFP